MSRYCSFWTHGTSVQVKRPDLVRIINRRSFGTMISQNAGTTNWFYFAIPTPTILADARVDHTDAYLSGGVNENAKLDRMHVWEGDMNLERFNGLEIVNQRRFDIERGITTDRGPRGGLMICAYVKFLTGRPRPEVWFNGAGARFRY